MLKTLKKLNIKAGILKDTSNSESSTSSLCLSLCSEADIKNVSDDVTNGCVEVRFSHPEALFNNAGRAILKCEAYQRKIAAVVIDEAHCILVSMGVHMPHITRIVHIAPPASFEEYVQEVGRAGRSGLQSYAYLDYCNSDISDNISKKGYITKPMIEYCRSSACLREHLLPHFGFKITFKQSSCCSSCQVEFQKDEMSQTVVLNENVRAIGSWKF